jgi:hypothetical protein
VLPAAWLLLSEKHVIKLLENKQANHNVFGTERAITIHLQSDSSVVLLECIIITRHGGRGVCPFPSSPFHPCFRRFHHRTILILGLNLLTLRQPLPLLRFATRHDDSPNICSVLYFRMWVPEWQAAHLLCSTSTRRDIRHSVGYPKLIFIGYSHTTIAGDARVVGGEHHGGER